MFPLALKFPGVREQGTREHTDVKPILLLLNTARWLAGFFYTITTSFHLKFNQSEDKSDKL